MPEYEFKKIGEGSTTITNHEGEVSTSTVKLDPSVQTTPGLEFPKAEEPSPEPPKEWWAFLKAIGASAAVGTLLWGVVAGTLFVAAPKPVEPPPIVIAAPTDTIQTVKAYYLRLKKGDGTIELRTGGTAAWRYSNPGKLLYGPFARQMGSIGSDGKLAVFPEYALGRRALEALLFEDRTYRESTIREAMVRFALKADGYDAAKYATALGTAAGVPVTTKMKDLDINQRKKLLEAVQEQENFVKGQVFPFASEEDFKKRGW